jgi:hypothetical protein
MKVYDFIYNYDTESINFGYIVSFDNGEWNDDGGLNTECLNIEAKILINDDITMEYYGELIYGVEELSLSAAIKKGLYFIFKEV